MEREQVQVLAVAERRDERLEHNMHCLTLTRANLGRIRFIEYFLNISKLAY